MPRRYPRGRIVGGSPMVYEDGTLVGDSPAVPDDNFRPIEMRQVQRTEVVGEWPQYTEVSMNLLFMSDHITINDKGRFVFRFDNGAAIYQLYPQQNPYGNSLKLELVRAR